MRNNKDWLKIDEYWTKITSRSFVEEKQKILEKKGETHNDRILKAGNKWLLQK